MWKMAGWLAKLAAAGLIISFLSIWTTGYIVNSYVETLLKQFNIPLEQKPFALSGVWGELWGADPQTKAKDTAAESSKDDAGTSGGKQDEGGGESADKQPDGSSAGSQGSGGASSGRNAGANGGESADGTSTGTPDGGSADGEDGGKQPVAVDAFGDLPDDGPITEIGGGSGTKANSGASAGGGSGETPGAGGQSGSAADASSDGLAMSTEDLNRAKSSMSDADKQQLFDIMMKKLPADAWQTISGWLEDGLTSEELTEAEQLIAQYLNRDEYDQMVAILKKY